MTPSESDAYALMARLAEIRRDRGITAVDAAARMDIDSKAISAWEHGRHVPLLHNVIAYARAIGVRLEATPIQPSVRSAP